MAKITVKDTEINVVKVNDEDYICLTDMLRAKDGDFFITDWLRNRNTLEFIGIWEKVYNPVFNYVEFATIKIQHTTQKRIQDVITIMAKITVQSTPVTVLSIEERDYISLTDMASAKEGDNRAADIIKNWIRNRYAIEFLGTWEVIHNPDFKVVEFDHFRKSFQRLKTEKQRLVGWSAKYKLSEFNAYWT